MGDLDLPALRLPGEIQSALMPTYDIAAYLEKRIADDNAHAYAAALARLEPCERDRVLTAAQTLIDCINGLGPLGAMELLAALGVWMGKPVSEREKWR